MRRRGTYFVLFMVASVFFTVLITKNVDRRMIIVFPQRQVYKKQSSSVPIGNETATLVHHRVPSTIDTTTINSNCNPKVIKNYTMDLPNNGTPLIDLTQRGEFASNYSACEVVWNTKTAHFANMSRILVLPTNITQYYFEGKNTSKYHRFDTGFVLAMADVLGIEIIPSINKTIREAVTFERSPDPSAHWLANHNHGRHFGDAILEHYGRKRNSLSVTSLTPEGCHNDVPRIGILNRKKNRRILNVQYLPEALQQSNVSFQSVSVQYFEDKDFIKQVEFFADIDVLVSPHGAQLTGIPFLPKCAQVLELFTAGYYVPGFYASLSNSAGLHHHSVYVGDEIPIDFAMNRYETRYVARKESMCPNVQTLADVICRIVRIRQNCCLAAVHG